MGRAGSTFLFSKVMTFNVPLFIQRRINYLNLPELSCFGTHFVDYAQGWFKYTSSAVLFPKAELHTIYEHNLKQKWIWLPLLPVVGKETEASDLQGYCTDHRYIQRDDVGWLMIYNPYNIYHQTIEDWSVILNVWFRFSDCKQDTLLFWKSPLSFLFGENSKGKLYFHFVCNISVFLWPHHLD